MEWGNVSLSGRSAFHKFEDVASVAHICEGIKVHVFFSPDVQKHLAALRQNLFLEENTLKPQSVLLTTVWLWSLEQCVVI